MDNKKFKVLIVVLILISQVKISSVFAQQTLLNDVSNLYMEKLVAAAKENYPKVKNFDSQVKVAKSDLSAAKISWLDPFSFQYVARSNQANTNAVNLTTSDILTGYQVGVSFNPSSFFSKPSTVNKAKEHVKIAEYEQSEYFLQLESMVKNRYVIFLRYQKALGSVNESYLNAQNSLNSIKSKYQRGEATFLEFNSASSSLNEAFQSKLQTEANYLSAKISLEELTVIPLENIK
jgi:outer membrane protein TolC